MMCAITSNRMFRLTAYLCAAMAAFALCAAAQVIPAETADQARIDRLIQQMSLEEKMNLIRGDVEPRPQNQGRRVICQECHASASLLCAWRTGLQDCSPVSPLRLRRRPWASQRPSVRRMRNRTARS